MRVSPEPSVRTLPRETEDRGPSRSTRSYALTVHAVHAVHLSPSVVRIRTESYAYGRGDGGRELGISCG